VPKLWRETIDEHRELVRDAILDATEQLVRTHGPLSLSMSQVAETTGIGRATLYKYFPDIETIVRAWHERHVRSHLERMSRIAEAPADPYVVLRTVLEDYANGMSRSHLGDVGAVLHRDAGIADAQRQLTDLLERLIAHAMRDGPVRGDVPPRDLATYCVHALAASRHLRTPRAVRRLVDVTLDGLAGHGAE
jgi:AcrR family transcriptional regulator